MRRPWRLRAGLALAVLGMIAVAGEPLRDNTAAPARARQSISRPGPPSTDHSNREPNLPPAGEIEAPSPPSPTVEHEAKSRIPGSDVELTPTVPVLQVDFDDTTLGHYSEAVAQSDWRSQVEDFDVPFGEPPALAQGMQLEAYRTNRNGYVVPNPEGGRMLRSRLPQGKIGNSINFRVFLDRSYPEAYLTYRVRFGSSFDFSRNGGKLPGLAGGPEGNSPKSCEPVDGTNGFSARMMWHRGGDLDMYVYHPDKPGDCGENFAFQGLRLTDDRWYIIQQRIVMNTPGRRDGLIEGWVDGVKRISHKDIRFRGHGVDDWGVNQLMFHTYFGGNVHKGWVHKRDEFMYYDDIVVSVPERYMVQRRNSAGAVPRW